MKPIIFSTEMVRAILEGRKTVTRRPVKPQPDRFFEVSENPVYLYDVEFNKGIINPPYQPGDTLWVREMWYRNYPHKYGRYWYRADGESIQIPLITGGTKGYNKADGLKWRPSIHMPKAAARIFLLVTNVLVERLQEITTEDATAEGCYCVYESAIPFQRLKGQSFEATWDSMYAKKGYSWGSNPWVWVIEFERTEEPS